MGLKNKLGKDKPWKNAGMNRKDFDDLVRNTPPDAVRTFWDEGHADHLVESMFGKDCKAD